MQSFIYLRGLKHADLTVFGVDKGQKTYYDPTVGYSLPYSSGQQIKRSIMESFLDKLGVIPAPITFVSVVTEKKGKQSLGEGAPLGLCDPSFPDQLIGGYMRADSKEIEEADKRTIKRRSPLSISALRPLHPALAGIKTENASFDRSDRPEVHKVIVRDSAGKELNESQIVDLLKGENRSLFRKWIPEEKRASGLFIYDVAIDLRRLFTVVTNQFEPEVSVNTINKLRAEGWTDGETVFGKCLVAPRDKQETMAKALAHALLNWQITSNQARTFSLMETLAIAIGDNASKIAGAIRAKLPQEGNQAEPIVDGSIDGVNTFVTLAAGGYIRTTVESANALDQAEAELTKRIMAYATNL